MASTPSKCDGPGCDATVVAHVINVSQRVVTKEHHFCEEHGRAYLAGHTPTAPIVPPQVAGGEVPEVPFDIETLVIQEQSPRNAIYLRQVSGEGRFHLICALAETALLHMKLKHIDAPRPLTHDAMANAIVALGGTLRDVLIDRVLRERGVYYAKLRIRQDTNDVIIDIRPSDALILAVIFNVPILVSQAVLCQPGT